MPDANIIRRDNKTSFKRLTGSTHTFHLQPFKGFRLEVDDIHYNLDSAVFLPALGEANPAPGTDPSVGLGAASESLLHIKKNPTRKALILGHADTSGDANYNVSLSVKRAKTAKAIILGERDEFVKTCQEKHKNEDIDHILKWVHALYGWDCAPVGQTRSQAIKKFQQRYNIEWEAKIGEDGSMGPQTWGAFFDVYQDMLLNLVETDEAGIAVLREKFKAAMHPPGMAGCGENFPLPINDPVFGVELPRPAYGYRSQADRRTEILFFDTGQEPKMDCHPGGEKCVAEVCEVYNTKMYRYTPIDVPDSKPRGNRVFLKMIYLDPEDKPKPFPKDFPVKIVYKDNTVQDEKVGDEGKLEFGAQRGRGEFTLKFDTPGPVYIAVSADDATNKLAKKADLAQLHKDKFRFFQVPKQWSLVESKWTVAENKFYKDDPDYKFFVPGRFGKTIGGSAAPVEMKLDPHWSFLRFEFADRHFCHSDHSHKRVNIPATLIGGWRTSPAGAGDPDTASHWTIKDTEVEKAVHAIPWIIQKKADNSADPRPDKNVQFEMKSDWLHASETPYVISKSATERVIETRADNHADLNPSAKRLEFYDLPKQWKSQNYYTRFIDNTGEFFDKASTFEQKIKDSLKAPDKFLAFSLDDIVLTDATLAPVVIAATDRVAIFFHKFVQDNAVGTMSNIGLWKPDTANNFSYYTQMDLKSKNYIFDYPNWTRLVIAQENLFDTFAERTNSGNVIGARAGVRWVDSPGTGPQAPATVAAAVNNMAAGVLVTRKYFYMQPFFEQRYAQTNLGYTGAASRQQGIGRYDLACIRCCDRDGDVERFTNMEYFRFFLSFNPAPPPAPPPPPPPAVAPPWAPLPSNFHPPTPAAAIATNRAQYGSNLSLNVCNRWNGHDTQNTHRTEFLPQQNTDKLKGQALLFIQIVNSNTRAHFTLDVVRQSRPGEPGAGVLGGRAWMFAIQGVGELSENSSSMEQEHSRNSYTAAHEVGHGGGMPDEYNERWNSFSYNEQAITGNTPGDAYEMDDQLIAAGGTVATTQKDGGMMVGNVNVRNRYFWHSAEFTRNATLLAGVGGAGGIALKVKYDTFDDYRIPSHGAAPARSHIYWPLRDSINRNAGPRGLHDVVVYPLGKDRYSQNILPQGPFDGILVVTVKVEYTLATTAPAGSANERTWIQWILPRLTQAVANALNNKFYATGTAAQGTPQSWTFTKCLIHFSPRYIVTNQNTGARYTTLRTNNGVHFTAQITDTNPNAPNTRWGGAAPNRQMILEYNSASPAAVMQSQLQTGFANKFCAMLGLAENAAAVTANDLLPLVQSVIGTNGAVRTLP